MASELNAITNLVPKTNSIFDDYIITDEVLGVGVNGKVLACIHKATKAKYALKSLNDSVKARREIDLQWRASIGCRHIVQIKDVYEKTLTENGKEVKALLVITECMYGGELFNKIIERTKTIPFTEHDVAKMMFEICSAVQHLHSNSIAHRDLKPENLLLTSNDDNAIIKICDFGFAKELSNSGFKSPCYTPYYVAPEVLKCELPGAMEYDLSCDIWSLGVIMYILICGKPPFFVSPKSVAPKVTISSGMKNRIKSGNYSFQDSSWNNVSNEAKSLIKQMLETNPQSRLKIDEIMNNSWIRRHADVPSTLLATADTLGDLEMQIDDINHEMTINLDEIRFDPDNNFILRDGSQINNPLYNSRIRR